MTVIHCSICRDTTWFILETLETTVRKTLHTSDDGLPMGFEKDLGSDVTDQTDWRCASHGHPAPDAIHDQLTELAATTDFVD